MIEKKSQYYIVLKEKELEALYNIVNYIILKEKKGDIKCDNDVIDLASRLLKEIDNIEKNKD